MNKYYKVIWSKVKNSYVVVSELAKQAGKTATTKSQTGQRIGVTLAVLALSAGISGSVWAADATDTTIVSGEVTYEKADGKLILTDSNAETIEIAGLKDLNTASVTLEGGKLTFTRNDGSTYTVSGIGAASYDAHFFSVNGPKADNPTDPNNYSNDGATGDNALAAGVDASAVAHNSIAIGHKAWILDSNGGKGSGDIAIGNGAKVENYADQSAGISLGQNAYVENMAGKQEAIFALGQTTFSGNFLSTARIPADPSKLAAGIAIGENSYVRSGSLMVGTHKYVGKLGDVNVDTSTEAGRRALGVGVNATTIGTNSFNHGTFSTITGAYSIATSNYAGGRNSEDAGKNFGAVIMGSMNSMESATAENSSSGVASSIVGLANKVANANGALVFGAGNEITNSVTSISIPGTGLLDSSSAANSAKELQDKMLDIIRNTDSGGSTLAIGGSNKADYTRASSIIGVKNTLTGTAADISQYNSIMGYNNKAENVDDVTVAGINNTITGTKTAVVFGDNRKLTGANNSIVLGSVDEETELTATDAVVIGHNANVETVGGVALGFDSIATIDKGVVGYDPVTDTASTKTNATWKSTLAAVSVGSEGKTRQITNVAAGWNDTDAVNVAQLRTVASAIGDIKNLVINGSNVQPGKNITVAAGNKVNLNDNITLGHESDTAKQVNINGEAAKVTAGAGENQVVADGSKGQVTIGVDNGNPGDQIIMGNQEASPIKPDGTSLGKTENGQFITGLDNTTWAPETNGYVEHRAATEGQLHDLAEKIGNIDTAVKDSSRVFAGDDGVKVTVKNGETLNLKGGADASNLSDGNIGVVANGQGLDIKLSKDITGLNSVTTGNATINNEGLTVKGAEGNTVVVSGDNVSMGGNVIHNVGAGEAPTDAVNRGQLDAVSERVDGLSGDFGNLNGRVNKLNNRVNEVGAGAAALAALSPLDFNPDDKWNFAVGYGNYKNADAFAIGAYYQPNEDTRFSIGSTLGNGDEMFNAGVSIRFGQSNGVSTSRVALAKDVESLKRIVQQLVAENEQLRRGGNGMASGYSDISTREFPDVPKNHWAYEYVDTIAKKGFTIGYPDGEFKGDRTLTRYEFAAVIYRALKNGAEIDAGMARAIDEFGPELTRLEGLDHSRVDRIAGEDNDRYKIERVRVNNKDNEEKGDYRDIFGGKIKKEEVAQ